MPRGAPARSRRPRLAEQADRGRGVTGEAGALAGPRAQVDRVQLVREQPAAGRGLAVKLSRASAKAYSRSSARPAATDDSSARGRSPARSSAGRSRRPPPGSAAASAVSASAPARCRRRRSPGSSSAYTTSRKAGCWKPTRSSSRSSETWASGRVSGRPRRTRRRPRATLASSGTGAARPITAAAPSSRRVPSGSAATRLSRRPCRVAGSGPACSPGQHQLLDEQRVAGRAGQRVLQPFRVGHATGQGRHQLRRLRVVEPVEVHPLGPVSRPSSANQRASGSRRSTASAR